MITCERLKTIFYTPTTCIKRQELIHEAEKRKNSDRAMQGIYNLKYEKYKIQCGGCKTGIKVYQQSLKKENKKVTTKKKTCTKCRNTYPATNDFFYNNKAAKDGFHQYCKVCHRPDINHKHIVLVKPDPDPKPPIEDKIFLNFSEHPKVLEKLQDWADDEMRPLEVQILYLLKFAMDKRDRQMQEAAA